jgi:hypothetical protein
MNVQWSLDPVVIMNRRLPGHSCQPTKITGDLFLLQCGNWVSSLSWGWNMKWQLNYTGPGSKVLTARMRQQSGTRIPLAIRGISVPCSEKYFFLSLPVHLEGVTSFLEVQHWTKFHGVPTFILKKKGLYNMYTFSEMSVSTKMWGRLH